MMDLFQTIKMEGNWWTVFIVNPANPKDRYMVTSTLDKKADADYFRQENMRLANLWREQFNEENAQLKATIENLENRLLERGEQDQ